MTINHKQTTRNLPELTDPVVIRGILQRAERRCPVIRNKPEASHWLRKFLDRARRHHTSQSEHRDITAPVTDESPKGSTHEDNATI